MTEVYEAKITDLIPDDKNANKHTARGQSMLWKGMRKLGAGRSVLIDKNRKLIGGNLAQEVAVDIGLEDVIIVPSDGTKLVAVQRTDIDLDTPEGRELAVSDNRIAQVSIDLDGDVLASLQAEQVDLSWMFYEDELALIIPETTTSPGDPGVVMDKAEEWRQKWGVERGQLWLLGRHRLACASAYLPDEVARLMNGHKPDMLHIDPPYGISIVKPSRGTSAAAIGGAKPFGSTGETKRKGANAVAERNSVKPTGKTGAPGNRALWDHPSGKVGGGKGDSLRDVSRGNPANIIQSNLYPVIEGDDTPFDPTLFLDFAPIVIMWGANYYADRLPVSSCWICWDKREDITRNNFADGELAWTNQDKPMRIFHHLWNGLHKGSQHGERRLHPTEKPVALFEEIGRMYADKGLWVDLFAGSGAQLVAAERTGATCYAMEWEPLYVATIIERLAQMGLTPRLDTQNPAEAGLKETGR